MVGNTEAVRGRPEEEIQPSHADLERQIREHEQARSRDGIWIRWGLGGVGVAALAVMGFGLATSQRLSSVEGDQKSTAVLLSEVSKELQGRRLVVDRFIALEAEAVKKNELGVELKHVQTSLDRLSDRISVMTERIAKMEPR